MTRSHPSTSDGRPAPAPRRRHEAGDLTDAERHELARTFPHRIADAVRCGAITEEEALRIHRRISAGREQPAPS